MTETVAAPPSAVSAKRKVRRVGLMLVVGSLLVIGLAVYGAWNPGNFVWVDRLFHHPFVFGVPVAVLGSVGFSLLMPRWLQPFCWGAGVLVALLWALGGLWWSAFTPTVVQVIAAPAGDGPSYELVVRSTSDGLIDPAWVMSIRTTGSLFAREWEFGCMSGDAPLSAYADAQWKSRDTLELHQKGAGSITIKVDQMTGIPSQPRGDDWSCAGWFEDGVP